MLLWGALPVLTPLSEHGAERDLNVKREANGLCEMLGSSNEVEVVRSMSCKRFVVMNFKLLIVTNSIIKLA